MQVLLREDHIGDTFSGNAPARLLLRLVLAIVTVQLGRVLVGKHCVLGELSQLLLGVGIADGVVVGHRLVNFLYLPGVVLYVLKNLVRVLRF